MARTPSTLKRYALEITLVILCPILHPTKNLEQQNASVLAELEQARALIAAGGPAVLAAAAAANPNAPVVPHKDGQSLQAE